MTDDTTDIPALMDQLKEVAAVMRTTLMQKSVGNYNQFIPKAKQMLRKEVLDSGASLLEVVREYAGRAKREPEAEFGKFIQYLTWSAWLEIEEEDQNSELNKAATEGNRAPRSHTEGKDMGEEHDFGWALHELFDGKAVARSGWNGPNQFVKVQYPDGNSFMTLPYIWIRTAQNQRVPWLISQTDALSLDWHLVGDESFPTGGFDDDTKKGQPEAAAGDNTSGPEQPQTATTATEHDGGKKAHTHDGGGTEAPEDTVAQPETSGP